MLTIKESGDSSVTRQVRFTRGVVMLESWVSENSLPVDSILLLLNDQRHLLARSRHHSPDPGWLSLIRLEEGQLMRLGQLEGETLTNLCQECLNRHHQPPISLGLMAEGFGQVRVDIHKLERDQIAQGDNFLMIQIHLAASSMDDRRHSLAQRYGLTRTQSRILDALLRGLDPQAIANLYSISLPTVRTHLKHLREKFGCRRTSELILRVVALPAASPMGAQDSALHNPKNHQK